MEIFVDGGLFEMIAALGLGYLISFICKSKYLLFIYSCLVIVSPLLLLILQRNELFYFLVAVCVLNAVLLVILLWNHHIKTSGKPLFNVSELRKHFSLKEKNKTSIKSR